ncbi:uncharacterized protein BT62DRAFT_706060 [Guyanagaster necrorhizus]|uniref:Secreted protein n=1 Tax=Guyanagaster necrorhizus TaxID=856835 RepID=A0A9P7VXI9_9AGAR|nr:uncharacterized protein BT62DRAFT_706060 [Guyanagaster necrorhizus MCA 3950]KAG7448433.1 hypothetical protein BT62DRAFT_706060 [Guyanagaster necrorhizus MCA 3950]
MLRLTLRHFILVFVLFRKLFPRSPRPRSYLINSNSRPHDSTLTSIFPTALRNSCEQTMGYPRPGVALNHDPDCVDFVRRDVLSPRKNPRSWRSAIPAARQEKFNR